MKTLSVLLVVTACLALASADQSSGSKNRKENALSKIVPRLLWNLHRGDKDDRRSQQPIIIVQQPSSNSDWESDRRHHHHSPYYPYYPPPPPPPPTSRPNPYADYLNGLPGGSGATFLIVNPNNAQGIYVPASSSNSSNSTSSRRSAFVPSIADILQGLNLDDLADGSLFEDDSEVVDSADEGVLDLATAAGASAPQADDDREDQDVITEDDVEALDRQTRRGLNPKHLVSLLTQDKRRRRIQEVLAGIYLRNYNLNRK
ncbi:uncharacterized protein Dana_GF15398 [Drosophila ananassae]|uniref:Uncharacterized protein n=2 Tax=Drosophila ananassae TaxID=7217 RepID=B3MKG5_DROAN|nr:uncharacterized protein Dana_GF15398 [Drosophila ananassae]